MHQKSARCGLHGDPLRNIPPQLTHVILKLQSVQPMKTDNRRRLVIAKWTARRNHFRRYFPGHPACIAADSPSAPANSAAEHVQETLSSKGRKLMSRLSLPILAALASALALSPLVASAQANTLAANQSSTAAPAFIAELELPVSSSNSSASAFDSPAQSSITTQAPAPQASEGGARPFSGIAATVKFGIAGVGFDVATPLVSQRLNLRGGASFFSYSPSTITTSDNLNVNGSLKFQNAAVMVDFFPFRGRFRLSGGMTVYNFTNLSATVAVPAGNSFTLGNTKYYSDPSKPLSGTAAFNFGGKTAGRVSIGTGNMLPRKGRFTFQSELGVQFFSQPTVAYNFSGNGCTTYNGVTYSNCGPVATADVTSEQTKIQNDLTDLRFFPILSIGLSYKIH
jgi:hypothetical protein